MPARSEHPALDELGDRSGRSLLEQLVSGPKAVGELVDATGLKQPNVSNHLARMRQRGLVTASRAGRRVFYALADPVVESLLAMAPAREVVAENSALATADIQRWADELLYALLADDEAKAGAIVRECMTRRLAMTDLYAGVLQPALYRIGDRYEAGLMTVAQEHLATAIVERLMARAVPYYPAAFPCGRTAVLGAAEGCHHSVGLRMIADALQQRGWRTFYLGGNVPNQSFLDMAAAQQPDLVCVTVAMAEDVEPTGRLLAKLRGLRAAGGDQPCHIAVGGLEVNRRPELIERWGVDVHARDVRAFDEMLKDGP